MPQQDEWQDLHNTYAPIFEFSETSKQLSNKE